MSAAKATTLLEPIKPAVFDPAQHCAGCKFPLVLDQTIQTVCQHTFHEFCLTRCLNKQANTIAETRRNAASNQAKFEEPAAIAPCPTCRKELEGTQLTPIASLPPGETDEDRDCGLCLHTKDPTVTEIPCNHLFHSTCSDEIIKDAEEEQAACPVDHSDLTILDLHDGAAIRQSLNLPPLAKPYTFRATILPAPREDTVHAQQHPHFHGVPAIPIYQIDECDACAEIVVAIVAVLLIASAIAYLANLFFFAGTNPILHVIGLPVGLILQPFFEGAVAGAIPV